MRHLWTVINEKSTKLRCQVCEEIMTFSWSDYAYEWMVVDKSDTCRGMPGPKPQNYRQMQEEY